MKMDFAVGANRNERMDEIADHARVAEESGFKFVTYVDQPFMSRDVFASMTIAALNTHRIHMGPGVLDLTTHHPLAIAGATASVDELSGGRVIVGIGAGGATGRTIRAEHLLTDFEAVIRRFSDTGVECVIVGGLAATTHGSARLAQDIDRSPSRLRPRNLMGQGIALHDDPAPAAPLVPPLFPDPAPGVGVVVEVVVPLGVGERVRIGRSRHRFAPAHELVLVARAAVRAGDDNHRSTPFITPTLIG